MANSSNTSIYMELTERIFRGFPLYPLTPGHDHTPQSYHDQTEPSVRDNNEATAGGSRALSDHSSGSQTRMRQGVKRKRQTSGRSESRERKRRKLDHRSGSESNVDQPGSSVRDHNEARAGRSRAVSDQGSDSQIKLRRGVKRKRQTSGGSESRENKRIRLDLCSGSESNSDHPGFSVRDHNEARAGGPRVLSDQSSDSQIKLRPGVKRKRQTSSRSESRESKRRRLDHRSGSESNDDQPGPSVRDNNEARAGASTAPSDQSSGSQIEMRRDLNRKRQTRYRSESKGWKRRSDHRSPVRPRRKLPQDTLTPGPDHTPLLSIVACNTNNWSIALDVSGETFEIAFCPTYNSPSETTTGKSSTDDEEPELSYLDSNSKDNPGGSTTSPDQSSDSQGEKRQGVKRKTNTAGRSERRERKSKRLDHHPGSDSNHDQTEPFVREDNEARAQKSRAPSDQSSGSLTEMKQRLKRRRKTPDRSESRERKSKRLDHHPGSDYHYQTEPFVRDNNEARARKSRAPSDQSSGSLTEMRQRLKRRRKTPDRSESRERKSKQLDNRSASDSVFNSDLSSDSLGSGFSSGLLGETSKDEQDSEVRASADQISQDEFRTGESRASSKQGSGNQVKMKQGLKTKMLASSRSQNRKSSKNRSDHGSDSNSDVSVRHNNEARAGRSRATSDQSSGSHIEMRRGLKRRRKTPDRSESRERKSKRLDHHSGSDSYYDQPGSFVRHNNQARPGRSRTPSDKSSSSQVERRSGLKTKRKASIRPQTRKSMNRLDHRSDTKDGRPDPSIGNKNQARARRPRAPSDHSSGSQVETRWGLKTKGNASIRSRNEKSTKNRLDHHSDSRSNDDQSDPSVRDNSEPRAGRSRACSDQSSDTQDEKRQGLKSKTTASRESQTRKSTKNRLDHRSDSDSNDDRSEHSNRENSETKTCGDQISQDESRQRIKRKISDLLDNQSKRRKSDHQSDLSINSLILEFSRMYISTPPAACGKTPMQPELSNRENSDIRASGEQIRQDESRKRVKRKISELPDTKSKRTRSDDQSDSSIDSLIPKFSRMYISTPPPACGEIATKKSNTDDELSQLVNNSKVRAEESKASSKQDSVSQAEARRGVKRNLKSTNRSVGNRKVQNKKGEQTTTLDFN